MRTTNKPREIIFKDDNRSPEIFVPPENWVDERFSSLRSTRNYKPSGHYVDEATVSGISTFGANPMKVIMRRPWGEIPTISMGSVRKNERTGHEVRFGNYSQGQNNIHIGNVAICEHVLAMVHGLGLRADFDLTAGNFPTPEQGLGPFLQALKGNLKSTGAKFVTVARPVMVEFENGDYAIFDPDDGGKKLIIDHQIAHPGNTIGIQRAVITITPEVFAYIALARTTGYNGRAKIARVLNNIAAGKKTIIPGTNLGLENVVFVDENGVINPRAHFDHGGKNWEFLMHEVVDKLGALALLPGRFVGKITTFRLNHHNFVEALRTISRDLVSEVERDDQEIVPGQIKSMVGDIVVMNDGRFFRNGEEIVPEWLKKR